MNKYSEQSKAPKRDNDDLLTWTIQTTKDYQATQVIFSDGTKATCKDKAQARRVINEKFFLTYF
jgi:hypothetical protein